MKRAAVILFLLLVLIITVRAEELQEDIYGQLELERAEELIPESIKEDDIDFSVRNTPVSNGMSIRSVLDAVWRHLCSGLAGEVSFVLTMIAILVFLSVIFTLIDASNTALRTTVGLVASGGICTVLIRHIENTFIYAENYISETTELMTGLLPFFGSLSVVGGEFTSAAVQKAMLLAVINILQGFIGGVALPVCKMVMAISVAGYISGIPLGAMSEFISSVATKIITLSCGIMCAILYFQNTVSSVTDSLALRSVKLAASGFIPIVGSFVSEASGTLISGVKLVKSTFGIFAICILLYMSIGPLIGFVLIKLAVRFSGIVAGLLGCNRETKLFNEVSSVYNILSAIMIASACFFVFFVSVFIQNGGK